MSIRQIDHNKTIDIRWENKVVLHQLRNFKSLVLKIEEYFLEIILWKIFKKIKLAKK